jgi:hypothetical protein
MRQKLNVAAAVIALFAVINSPAWAVNKCSIDGKTVFQDALCPGKGEAIKVRPASGSAPAPASDASAAGVLATNKPVSEAQRIEARVKESQNSRRKTELQERLVPNTMQSIWLQRQGCDREFEALRNKKRLANNNLAGATWENSISSEMTAVATRCDSKARELELQLETLKRECGGLGGCK